MGLDHEKFDCIVLGAGIAGIAAANKLRLSGLSVCVLEKSRGIGGRLSTRRITGQSFDHGAQFFTAREDGFIAEVEKWVVKGIARPWFGAPDRTRFCGSGGMNPMVKALAEGLDVKREQKVEWIGFDNGTWSVRTNLETFEGSLLLLTNPAPQAVDLLEVSDLTVSAGFFDTLKTIEYEKCISLMLLLESELGLSETGIIQNEPGEPIATLTETSVKGITDRPGIVIQSSPEFAEEKFGSSSDSIVKQLTDALPYSGPLKVEGMSLQKWRFAKRKDHDLKVTFLQDESKRLWHAGDGYIAPKIEGAFLSGERVAESILATFRLNGVPDSNEPGEPQHAD